MKRRAGGGVVYSTGVGRVCPACGEPQDACRCHKEARASAPGDGVVRVRLEVKGRHGKSVTVVNGLPVAGEALRDLAAELKRRCGAGGAVKDGNVEIQGDHRDAVLDELGRRGFRAKRAGGR